METLVRYFTIAFIHFLTFLDISPVQWLFIICYSQINALIFSQEEIIFTNFAFIFINEMFFTIQYLCSQFTNSECLVIPIGFVRICSIILNTSETVERIGEESSE